QQPRGRSALKRLRVYLSVPDEFKEKPLETVEVAKRPPQGPFMSLGEIARLLGSKFEGHARRRSSPAGSGRPRSRGRRSRRDGASFGSTASPWRCTRSSSDASRSWNRSNSRGGRSSRSTST